MPPQAVLGRILVVRRFACPASWWESCWLWKGQPTPDIKLLCHPLINTLGLCQIDCMQFFVLEKMPQNLPGNLSLIVCQPSNSHDAQASLRYYNRHLCCDWLLSSAMCSNDDNAWPVHSLMLSLRDLRSLTLQWLPSTVPCCVIFGSVSWQQTWPNHDNLWHLTVDNKSWWHLVRKLNCCHTYSFVFCSLYDMVSSPPVAFVFKGLDSPLQILHP